jgi:hypothetical protein
MTPAGAHGRLRQAARAVAAAVLAAAAVAGAAGAAGGCARPGTLDGSISATIPLGFDDVELVLDDDGALLVRYLDEVSYPEVAYEGTNTVAELRVTADVGGMVAGEPLDVTGAAEVARYVIVLTDDDEIVQDARLFPEIFAAELTLDAVPRAVGDACAGRFRVIFVDGTTLRGTFDGVLVAPSY